MFKINEMQKKVTITKDQLRKEEEELERVTELLGQVDKQEEELSKKESQLIELGKKYNVNFNYEEDEKR